MLLSQSDFSRAVGVSRQSIFKAIESGFVEKTGKNIDTNSKLNAIWIQKDANRRKAFAVWEKNSLKEPKKTEKKDTIQKVKTEIVPENCVETTENSEQTGHKTEDSSDINSPSAVAHRTNVMKMKVQEENYITKHLENKLLVNEQIKREKMEFCTQRFLNHFVSGIPLVSSTALTDISKIILAEGKITNEHYSLFEAACMELVHGAKEKLRKDVENLNL